MKLKKWTKWGVLMMCAMTLLTACGEEEKSPEQIKKEAVLTENLKNAPEIDKEIQSLIEESFGTPVELTEEELLAIQEQGGEVPPPENSLSPGEQMALSLASYTKEELMEQSAAIQINIFVNGVIRDEYSAAATTLYGAENIKNFKKSFNEALVKPTGVEGETTYIDRLGTGTAIRDGEVAKHFVDDVVKYLNRTYVDISIAKDFGDKVTVNGSTYNVELVEKMKEIKEASEQFVKLPERRKRSNLTEEQSKNLNKYYKETFSGSLESAVIDVDKSLYEVGGFKRNEEGLWVPSQMETFAYGLIHLVYLT